MKELAEKN